MGIKYNLISGVFAALAAVCTKVGFNFTDGPIETEFLPSLSKAIGTDSSLSKYLLHGVFIVLMLLSNALMLRFYVSSMHENGAAKATVYNFAVNYLSSIAFGALLFGEQITMRLALGVALILSGTWVIAGCSSEKKWKVC